MRTLERPCRRLSNRGGSTPGSCMDYPMSNLLNTISFFIPLGALKSLSFCLERRAAGESGKTNLFDIY